MQDNKTRISTGAAIAVAVVALLTAWFARHDAPRPPDEVAQQSVVTAPPMATPNEAATAARSSVMGGPPAQPDASR